MKKVKNKICLIEARSRTDPQLRGGGGQVRPPGSNLAPPEVFWIVCFIFFFSPPWYVF